MGRKGPFGGYVCGVFDLEMRSEAVDGANRVPAVGLDAEKVPRDETS